MTAATVVDPTAATAFFCGGGPVGACDDGPSLFSVVRVPIKVHLHNDAVLGPNCYIGSDASPIVLNLVETPTSTPSLRAEVPEEMHSFPPASKWLTTRSRFRPRADAGCLG